MSEVPLQVLCLASLESGGRCGLPSSAPVGVADYFWVGMLAVWYTSVIFAVEKIVHAPFSLTRARSHRIDETNRAEAELQGYLAH